MSSAPPVPPPSAQPAVDEHAGKPLSAPPEPTKWRSFVTPLLVLLLALAVILTITWNWNSSEGGRTNQTTDDAYVRGDLTPLSTKVSGIVGEVKVGDYQQVHKGDVLVALESEDFKAQVSQATAAVEAGKAALKNNLRQRELQDARIDRAVAGVEQARAQIAAAQAGIEAVKADVTRTQLEQTRQETLLQTRATTQQKLEAADADQQRFVAMAASRQADLEQAKTLLRSSELGVEAERRTKEVIESQNAVLEADLHAKEAQLDVAQVNLAYTQIAAPSDGTVGERLVRAGQFVGPGTQVISFIDSARWIQANFRETQLTHMKVGDAAEIKIDVYPGQTLQGKVEEIAPASGSQFALLPPDNATGNYTKVVQRVPVKIVLQDSDLVRQLRPGISAVVTVRTSQ
jgi:membrane fusion protein, multidrug efflux system